MKKLLIIDTRNDLREQINDKGNYIRVKVIEKADLQNLERQVLLAINEYNITKLKMYLDKSNRYNIKIIDIVYKLISEDLIIKQLVIINS